MDAEHFGRGGWDLPRMMNPLDALLWRCDADPRFRFTMVMVAILDHAPDWERFAAGHEWASRMVPRLRDRPATSWLYPTVPFWQPDPEFDPRHHCRRIALPEPAGRTELLAQAERALTEPFDWNRPPWESRLIEKVTWKGQTRAAWVLRFHHCLADAEVMLSWFNGLLSRTAERRRDKPQPPLPPRGQAVSAGAAGVGLLRELGRALRGAAGDPDEMLGALATIGDLTVRSTGAPSVVLSGRSLERRVAILDLPTAELMAAMRTLSASVRDLFVTGMLGGFRRYHVRAGHPRDTIGIGIPLPLRNGLPARAGNHFGGLRLAAPLGEPDARIRLDKVRAQMTEAEEAFHLSGYDALLAGTRQLPTPTLTALAGNLAHPYDLQLTAAGAFLRPLYVAGAEAIEIPVIAPLSGGAVLGALSPRPATSSIGLTYDPAAVDDPAGLLDCLREGMAEVTALAE